MSHSLGVFLLTVLFSDTQWCTLLSLFLHMQRSDSARQEDGAVVGTPPYLLLLMLLFATLQYRFPADIRGPWSVATLRQPGTTTTRRNG